MKINLLEFIDHWGRLFLIFLANVGIKSFIITIHKEIKMMRTTRRLLLKSGGVHDALEVGDDGRCRCFTQNNV